MRFNYGKLNKNRFKIKELKYLLQIYFIIDKIFTGEIIVYLKLKIVKSEKIVKINIILKFKEISTIINYDFNWNNFRFN